jgi:hypothetical protein
MPKPASFDKGKRIPKKEYKKKLDEYYEKRHPDFYENKGFLKKFGLKCIDKALFKRIKNEARRKFKPYPSNNASAWIKSQYKKRGGKLRGKEQDITDKEKETLSNLRTAVLDTVEEETNERKIVERRGDAKEGDLWIHPNTGNLKMKVGDKWITVNDPNELPKINNQKRRKDLSAAFAERRKKEQIEEKIIKKVEKAKITRGQFLYKYKSPQNFYSWQDLAREHINCSYRNQQYIYNSPAYYLKDDLCNSLINTNIDNLKLSERPNIVNPSFFLLNSNNINRIKYSFIECHKWSLKGSKLDEEPESFSQIHDVYVNFVIDPDKILYFAFSWKDLKMPKFSEMNKLRKDPYSEEEIRCFEDQFHTVVNLLLLMNQQPDIITEEYIPSKVIDIQKKYKIQSPIKPSAICWVGKDFTRRVIKLKPKINEEDFVISGNTRKIRPHWRRGHWHTVLKGKNRKERKMRWYQPVFVVGSQAA